jgi:dTDP-4-dehydrorhamnose reductase
MIDEMTLIVGADGMLGRHLSETQKVSGLNVFETSRRKSTLNPQREFLDLAGNIMDWKPPAFFSTAFLGAAVTSIKACDKAPTETRVVNVDNTLRIAERLLEAGTFVLFPSSNLVFNGRQPFCPENTAFDPSCEYGRQKAEAEFMLLSAGRKTAIIRFSKIIHPMMEPIRGWIHDLRNGRKIHPFSDMILSPVPVNFAVSMIHKIGEMKLPGIWQISGNQDLSYAQVARHISHMIGANKALVQPISVHDALPRLDTLLPKHTTLKTHRIENEFGIRPPDVWEAINKTFSLQP